MHTIIRIGSSVELDELRTALAKATVLRVSVDGQQVSFKIGGGMWSIPMGSLDPECAAAQKIAEAKALVDATEYCPFCEHRIPGHYGLCRTQKIPPHQ